MKLKDDSIIDCFKCVNGKAGLISLEALEGEIAIAPGVVKIEKEKAELHYLLGRQSLHRPQILKSK